MGAFTGRGDDAVPQEVLRSGTDGLVIKSDLTRRRGEREESEGTASLVSA